MPDAHDDEVDDLAHLLSAPDNWAVTFTNDRVLARTATCPRCHTWAVHPVLWRVDGAAEFQCLDATCCHQWRFE